MPDRFLSDTVAGEPPAGSTVQEIIEAESGRGAQGIRRAWQASDSNRVVLTSDAGGVKISRDNGITPPTTVVNVGTPAGGDLAGTYPGPTLSAATMNALIPPGSIWAFGRDIPPTGWALCNGQAVSRAANPILFGTIFTFYGVGDGSTTFNLPNLTGRVILMASGPHPLASNGGAEAVSGPTHTHPGAHSHGMNGHAHTVAQHQHGVAHDHGINHSHTNAHTHDTDLNHDHANATSAASTTTLNGRFTAGGASALPDTHTHDVNLPGLGATSRTSGASSDGTTSGTATASATSSISSSATDGPTGTGTVTGSTTDDASAHGASYGAATIATMMPFTTCAYIIRLG